MTEQLSRRQVEWLRDAATEFASTSIKMTMKPEEVLQLTTALLAGMDSKPVAYLYSASFERGHVEGELTDAPGCDMPVYSAPPAPVAVPNELTHEEYKRRFMEEDNFDDTYRGGFNACRAAMLKAGPVTAATVPDGWKLVPVEPTKEMIDAGWSYYMTTKSPSSLGVYGAMLAAAPEQEV